MVVAEQRVSSLQLPEPQCIYMCCAMGTLQRLATLTAHILPLLLLLLLDCWWCLVLLPMCAVVRLGHHPDAVSAARAFDRAALCLARASLSSKAPELNFPVEDYEGELLPDLKGEYADHICIGAVGPSQCVRCCFLLCQRLCGCAVLTKPRSLQCRCLTGHCKVVAQLKFTPKSLQQSQLRPDSCVVRGNTTGWLSLSITSS